MHASWEAVHAVRGESLNLAEVLTHAFVAGCLLGRAVMGTSMFPCTISRQSPGHGNLSQNPCRWCLPPFSQRQLHHLLCSQPVVHCSMCWLGLQGEWQQHSVFPQQWPTAACSSCWRLACGIGSKVSSSSCAPSLLGELLKTAQLLLCYGGDMSFGRLHWFWKCLLFLLVRGIWCYSWISILGYTHDVLEGLFCRCLYLSRYESLCTVVGGGQNGAELNPCDFSWSTGLLLSVCLPNLSNSLASCLLIPTNTNLAFIFENLLEHWLGSKWAMVKSANLPLAIYSVKAGCLPGCRPVTAHLADGASCWLWWRLQKVFDLLATKPTDMLLSHLFYA